MARLQDQEQQGRDLELRGDGQTNNLICLDAVVYLPLVLNFPQSRLQWVELIK